MNGIKSLEETSPGVWRAKYQGNYGVYTIKIVTDGKKTKSFSCSCPSSGHPCKHIGMVEEAIAGRIKKSGKPKADSEIEVAELLRDVPHKELYDFIVRQAENNTVLADAIALAFSSRLSGGGRNVYSAILRSAFEKVNLEDHDIYDYDGNLYVEPLDQWINKIEEFIERKDYGEALSLCKACIEEFAAWLDDQGDELYFAQDYESELVKLLETMVVDPDSGIDARELYDYCVSEMEKDKYAETEMFEQLNDLLMTLSARVNPEEFLVLQDKLLEEVEDKSSYRAEKILGRKLAVYRENKQAKKAWELIRNNIQIESFRKELVEKYIEEKKYGEAKKLIAGVKEGQTERGNYRRTDRWDEFLLEIARKEADTPNMRKIAYLFIEDHFLEKYYRIYKSTFSAADWPEAAEALIKHYQGANKYFSSSAADLMVAEEDAEALLLYLEKYPSVSNLAGYYPVIAGKFPLRTLALFRLTIDAYAEQNTGRRFYEDIIRWLKMVMKIKGGAAVAADMLSQYRARYKNRRAMQEMLGGAFPKKP
jgi:uncharacterized protein (DUF2267 family)